ncbi:ATP synthase F0 subunit 8 (mitochondrion) [Desmodus rotundus]|uniref:ATP synthase complex subunit 8 n=1 Tax=Desmodus rotundus TaxID=9430 RepID=T2KF58_DESRO|nr:ATP synthase F0 subunit 8 [Desmodus rotundus]CDF66034.1 ATP8 [Desmodus rotundus]
MPQLDTSTWSTTVFSTVLALFTIMQLKISTYLYHTEPEPKSAKMATPQTPWETKWTKTYSPLSLPL